MTFIDNSDLSVCEKIKLYFAKTQQPAYASLNSSASSTSSSADFDASFQQMLEESRRRKANNSSKCKTMAGKSAEYPSSLLVDETTIDLCSSPESVGNPMASPRIDVSPHVSAFNGTLFGSHDPRQRAAVRQLQCSPFQDDQLEEGENLDDSLGVATLDDIVTQPEATGERPWYLNRSASDTSFLEHERQCQEEDDRERQIYDCCASETLLDDVEEPSMMWNQTISNDTLPAAQMRKTNVFWTRPSTIAEESTINSSSASSQVSKSGAAIAETSFVENLVPMQPTKSSSYRESSMNVFPKKMVAKTKTTLVEEPFASSSAVPKPKVRTYPIYLIYQIVGLLILILFILYTKCVSISYNLFTFACVFF